MSRTIFFLYVLILLSALVIVLKAGDRAELAAYDAHVDSDNVLGPLITAAISEYESNHPQGPEHYRKLSPGDRKRLDAVKEAIKNWQDKIKEAGY